MALVMERDDILKRTIDKENCETKEFYVHSLKKILNQAPMEVFLPDTEDTNLKKLLHELKSQVVEYCESRGIQSPAPVVPAPPPLPSIPAVKPATSKSDNEQYSDKSRLRDLDKSKLSSKPLNSLLVNEILNTGNRKLRPTGFKHSPGGTPMKRKRRLSLRDQADLLQVALEKKFQNVVASPVKLHSPSSFSVSTPNLASCEMAPDPGLTTESLSAIWNDTPSIMAGQEDTSKDDTPGSTAV